MPLSKDTAPVSTEWLYGLKELAIGSQFIPTDDFLQLRWPHLALRGWAIKVEELHGLSSGWTAVNRGGTPCCKRNKMEKIWQQVTNKSNIASICSWEIRQCSHCRISWGRKPLTLLSGGDHTASVTLSPTRLPREARTPHSKWCDVQHQGGQSQGKGT